MKGIIIYKGKYGATEQYATWLADELQIPAIPVQECKPSQLKLYDFVIITASVYIGKWLLKEWVEMNSGLFGNKKIFYVIVCGTPSSQKEKQSEIVKNNFTDSARENAEFFFLPGRVIIKNLSWKDRMLLKIGSMMEKDPVQKLAMQKDVDGVDKKMLAPLISKVIAYASDQSKEIATTSTQVAIAVGH